MEKIESIKQKILQLDPGTFQSLCDAYLSKKGYSSIVSLGGEAGTRKTTLGTPDTYFVLENGNYIFVEYTTQKTNLFSKIKDDLEKCLDISRTGIPHDKIAEIIYCHTSSNITSAQDDELRTLCKNVEIKLTIIGIDELAEEIYLFYHILSRDFLGISISTDQIQSCDDFIKYYNSNKMAAPIDTEFLFREKEIKDIENAFLKENIVILSGVAGTGKTRLALHYTKNHKESDNEKIFCIHSNTQPIYEDLKIYIENPGNYFLFIDDANQLSGLENIIRYVNMKPEGYNVKILITVRDYALQKVINDIQKIASYKIINIKLFSDDELKKLLETSLEIRNQTYLEKIVMIAEGNARIAVLAGKMACSSSNLHSINDVSQLYEGYYASFLEDNLLLANNKVCITIGIVAFLEVIHLERIDVFLSVLQKKELNREEFIEIIYLLHEKEIVDIFNDKVVRFSEQCLSNYLLKYIFFDKKLISLSEMIKVCFQSYRERTISSINTLLNIFRNKIITNFVEKEIKKLWDELSMEKSPIFFEFIKVFFRVNPTETLLILQNKIEVEEDVICECCDIDTEKGKNYQNITNDIIEILGGFTNMNDELLAACDLFFQYYLKRPDLYIEFYHAANLYFSIGKDSEKYDYFTQITFFEKIKEYSNDWKQELVTFLFLDIAKDFLKLHFSPTESGRKKTVIFYRIPLLMSEGVKKYRKIIWESLLILAKNEKYREKIREIINNYGEMIKNESIPVLEFDMKYIILIFELSFSTNKLENSILANRILQIFKNNNLLDDFLFSKYFENESFQLYSLLKGRRNYEREIDYDEIKRVKQKSIEQYASECNLEMFKKLIDVCNELLKIENQVSWEIKEGLEIAFDFIFQKKDYYVDAIKYYIEKDTPDNLYPNKLVENLFSLLPASEVYQIIIEKEYSQKNAWLYAYYHELPLELIDKKHLYGLYNFLEDTSDKNIVSSPLRNVDFLKKYNIVDNEAFIEGCKIILSKMEYSPFIVHIYFNLLFNGHYNTSQELFKKFNYNLELLEKIYFSQLIYYNYHDYDGQFLKEIYLIRPCILDRYINYLIDKEDEIFNEHQRYICFFELNDFLEIYNKIFEQLIKKYKFPEISGSYFLEKLLLSTENKPNLLLKQDKWICENIQQFSNDKTKMYCLFSAISKLEMERKKKYILIFLKNNSTFEDFKSIPLIPTSYSWSGSVVPMYFDWIDFLNLLLPYLVGIKWIKHKNYIEKTITYLRKEIECEQIDEILRG